MDIFQNHAIKYNIDFSKANYRKIESKQGDVKSRFIEFTIMDNCQPFDLTNLMVKIFAVKTDHKNIFNDCQILNAKQGIVLAELTSQTLAIVGELDAELVIFSQDGKKLSSRKFIINVLPSINNEDAVVSANEYGVVCQLILDVNLAKKNIGVMGSLKDALEKTIKTGNDTKNKLDATINTANATKNDLVSKTNAAKDQFVKETNNAKTDFVNKANAANTDLVNKTNDAKNKLIKETDNAKTDLVNKTNDAKNKLIKETNDAKNDLVNKTNAANQQFVKETTAAKADLVNKTNTAKTSLDESIKNGNNVKNQIDNSTSQGVKVKNELNEIISKGQLQGGKYTEYTGENITCNNTLDGATKDMVIEGVTYQNICIDSNIERTLNSKHRIQEHNLVSLIPANTDFRININITGKKAPKFGLLVYFVDANAGKPCYDILTKEVYHQNICFRKNYPISKIAIYLEQKEIEGDSTAYITYKDFSVVLDKNYNQYVEGIKSVGEDEENEINILSTGKNLFDLSQIKYSKSDTNSIIPIKNGLRLENIWATSVCFKHNLKPSTKYTTSLIYKEINPPIGSTDNSGGKMLLYSSRFKNKPLIYLFGDKGSKHTFTTPKDIEDYDMIYLYSAGGGGSYNGIVEITNIQVEESSSQTPYESCKSDDTDILLPSPLRCLSKEVKDTIELINNKWFHVQRIGKTVLNGDEYWCYEQNKYKDKMGFYSWLKISKGNNIIADKLKVSSYGDIVGDNNKNKICTLDGDYNVIRVGMQKSSLSPQNEEGLKKWLKENPVIIYYELKTPILTPLDAICNLKTYDGITHIFSKNVIPPTLKFKIANSIGTAMRDEFNYLEKSDELNITKTKNEIDNKIIVSNTQPDSKSNEIWIEIE